MQLRMTALAAIAAPIGLSLLWPPSPATCRDGWASPSIGRSGACSWHGGVKRGGGLRFLAMVASAAGAARLTFIAFKPKGAPKPPAPPSPRAPPPHHPRTPADSHSRPTERLEEDQPVRHRPIKRNSRGNVGCPKCGAVMVTRKAKHGSFAGRSFWGCSRFPECRGTRRK